MNDRNGVILSILERDTSHMVDFGSDTGVLFRFIVGDRIGALLQKTHFFVLISKK